MSRSESAAHGAAAALLLICVIATVGIVIAAMIFCPGFAVFAGVGVIIWMILTIAFKKGWLK